MSLIADIERYRQRVSAAQAELEEKRRDEYPDFNQLPPDFYNPQQLSKYHKVDELMTKTSAEFMDELGLEYRLDRNFRLLPPVFGFGKYKKEMYFVLKLSGFDKKYSEGHIWIEYQVGKEPELGELMVQSGIAFLIPPKRKNYLIDVREAVDYLGRSEATFLSHSPLNLDYIDEIGIRNMLTLIVINPKNDLLLEGS